VEAAGDGLVMRRRFLTPIKGRTGLHRFYKVEVEA
jgi:hypothetical protein